MAELLNLFATIIIFGMALGIVNLLIPMPASIKSLLSMLVIVILILYILQYFSLVNSSLPKITIFK